jgi:hypothetical protein
MYVFRFWTGKYWKFSTSGKVGKDEVAGKFVFLQHPDSCPDGRWVYEATKQVCLGVGAQPTYNWILGHLPH